MKTVDKEEMGNSYIEMASINLSIANEFFMAEHIASTNYENSLKGE